MIPDFLKSCCCTSDMETAKIKDILQELRSDYERHFSGEQEKESSLNLYFKVIQLNFISSLTLYFWATNIIFSLLLAT